MPANSQWFLAQLRPNGLCLAERNLLRQGFRIFNPRQRQTRRRGGRFVTENAPLFPGYLFVSFDPRQGQWRAINSTYGVARLVSFGGQPRPVPGRLVDGLAARTDADGQLGLAPGDRVRITAGAFAEFVATVDRLAPDQRVWLLLDIMGRETRVAVESTDLAPCERRGNCVGGRDAAGDPRAPQRGRIARDGGAVQSRAAPANGARPHLHAGE
ncbi:transcriptional antiterminator RfaH [Rhodovulum marinum]|uniref:Transcriptional antiterminator RfaH n=2 Tax=Rhodovulum marinum TaxID=320662 RepID=A0A4R2PTF7_9RHOB|nr:transcription termination/antitermination NusG family protein [Rhodovulum marinum]TCP39282.1 transcriptional antiterminator RfaH [Rhodovulum marinum]